MTTVLNEICEFSTKEISSFVESGYFTKSKEEGVGFLQHRNKYLIMKQELLEKTNIYINNFNKIYHELNGIIYDNNFKLNDIQHSSLEYGGVRAKDGYIIYYTKELLEN